MTLNLRQFAAASVLLCPMLLGAQELPSAPSAVAQERAATATAPEASITFAMPDSVAGSSTRLDTNQKFSNFISQTTSPYTTFSSAIAASFRPAWNNSQYAETYASRFGQSVADQTEQGFFTKFLLPSALHQDPRYFRSDDSDVSDRFTYAISRILVGRNDNGKSTLNTSEILGSVLAASISTAYHPIRRRTAGDVASSAGGSMGADAGMNLLREFWPDIREHLMDRGPRAVQNLVGRMAPRTIAGTVTQPVN
ncbi:MAG TPA: hypothetical protein VGL89_18100 [Candidatus Koribacter sp.]|jgi:hypothetical protein